VLPVFRRSVSIAGFSKVTRLLIFDFGVGASGVLLCISYGVVCVTS
jgi:hypothetical protein